MRARRGCAGKWHQEMAMENVSTLDDVVLLVRLDSADTATQTPKYVQALIDEAKRRGLFVLSPISPSNPHGRREFTISSLSTEKLRAILTLVTRNGFTSRLDLQNAVQHEIEERKPSKAKSGDTIYLSTGKLVKIDSVEKGVVLYPMKGSLKPVQIQNLEPSPAHRRGCWVVNPKI
jgi:hypothetical protein